MPRARDIFGKCRFLTAEEEREQFRRWRENGDRDAHEIIVKSIAAFALRQAAKFVAANQIPHEIQEYESLALEGLLRAIEKFDPERGIRLSTYAGHWIFQKMQRGRSDHRLIPIPVYLEKDGTHKYRAKGKAAGKVLELDAPTRAGDKAFPWIADARYDPADLVCDSDEVQDIRRRIWNAIESLDERQKFIVMRRAFDGLTLEEIAGQIGVSKERVRQLETKAHKMMKAMLERPVVENHQSGERDPVALLEQIQRVSPGEIETAIRDLNREKAALDANYKRRLGLLKMLQKAAGGGMRQARHRAANNGDGDGEVLAAVQELGHPTATELAEHLVCLPRIAGVRASALVRRGSLCKSDDGRYSVAGEIN